MTRIAVVSPHLDDGLLSLGAAVRSWVRTGHEVSVVTVCAGVPTDPRPAGWFDAKCGFRTAGEAVRARRREDADACARAGAAPVWLPYGDDQYGRGADDDAVTAAVVAAVAGHDAVLLPGFPLQHDDHAWVSRALSAAIEPQRLGFYVEQPYAAAVADEPRLPAWAPGALRWSVQPMTVADVLHKARLADRYRSQHHMLGRHWHRRSTAYELRRGGETVAWATGHGP